MQALIDGCDSGRIGGRINQVISNRASAAGLGRAQKAGIETSVLDHNQFDSREAFDTELADRIALRQPDLVVLAGFMRIIGAPMLDHFGGRMINLHPSLLPRHMGTDTYQRAIDAGDTEHGASIHFVTAELDGGPVITQVSIPIEPVDTAASLAARLGPQEHRLIVATVELFCRHQVECRHGMVYIDEIMQTHPLILQPDDKLE